MKFQLYNRKNIQLLRLLLILFVLNSVQAYAQYSDLDLSMSKTEQDSLTQNYDNIFPFFGGDLIKQGIRLPAPLGININYFTADQNVLISNLALGVNDRDYVNLDNLIRFDEAIGVANNWNARIDLWIFPFLNVYGIGGYTRAITTVNLISPIEFQSEAKMEGTTYGTGFTIAGGLQGFWISFDANWSWSDLDILENPIGSSVIGLRVGKNYRWRDKSVALWLGAMKVNLESGTQGTVLLLDVLPDAPPELGENLNEWYDNLSRKQKLAVDKIIAALEGNKLRSTRINYSLDKKPETPWTMNVGGQLEFNRNWQFRAEFNFLGARTSILANLVYRLDI